MPISAIHAISWPFGNSWTVNSHKPGELQTPSFFCSLQSYWLLRVRCMPTAHPSRQVGLVSEHSAHKAHCALYTIHWKIHSLMPFLSSIFTFLPAAAPVTTLTSPKVHSLYPHLAYPALSWILHHIWAQCRLCKARETEIEGMREKVSTSW